VVFAALAGIATAAGAEIDGRPAPIDGELLHGGDLSGIARIGDFVVVASDEGAALQVLVRRDDGGFQVHGEPIRLPVGDGEADIEGLAAHGDTLYAVGSHALRRRTVKPGCSRTENLGRLATVDWEPSRGHLFRIRMDPESGRVTGKISSHALRPTLRLDPVLGRFADVPGGRCCDKATSRSWCCASTTRRSIACVMWTSTGEGSAG